MNFHISFIINYYKINILNIIYIIIQLIISKHKINLMNIILLDYYNNIIYFIHLLNNH